MGIDFTGERIVPGAANCEPAFAQKMYQEHVARYAFAAELAVGRDVLDVACGVGYGSQWLAKNGAKSVLGIDIADDAIEHARQNYFHQAVKFEVADALELEFEGTFDVITCFEFIEHVEDQRRVLDGIKRALRPSGLLIISTPRPLEEKRTGFHVHELTFEELRELLSERFPVVQNFFERNCFTSFVGAKLPETLDRLVSVTNELQLDDADYFIFVAQVSGEHGGMPVKPVLAVNDDRYVLRLEQDIVNLRNGENYHNQLINDLSQKNEKLSRELESARSELDGARKRLESLNSMHEEMSKIAEEVASIRAEFTASSELLSVKSELDAVCRSRDDFARQTERLVSENGRIRTVLSKVAQQLAETETRLNSKEAEFAHSQADFAAAREDHVRKMQELAARYEQSERTLNRFRRSVSWKVTRPIRWIGRQFRRISGRSVA